jgi:hypothetical protein
MGEGEDFLTMAQIAEPLLIRPDFLEPSHYSLDRLRTAAKVAGLVVPVTVLLVVCMGISVIDTLNHLKGHIVVARGDQNVSYVFVAGKLGKKIGGGVDHEHRLVDLGVCLGQIEIELLPPVIDIPVIHDATGGIYVGGDVRIPGHDGR